jgi:uncharacterized protein with von Willebrand factor type A (vWA) domain
MSDSRGFAALSNVMIAKIIKEQSAAALEDEDMSHMHLSKKLEKFIKRIASLCMGPAYAIRFMKDQTRRQVQRDKDFLEKNKDIDKEIERLASMGIRATLVKTRPPRKMVGSPPKDARSKSPSKKK